MQRIRTGQRVEIGWGSGVDSGKTGRVAPLSEVGTNHRGIPNIPGEYKRLGREWQVVALDEGGYTTMLSTRLMPAPVGEGE